MAIRKEIKAQMELGTFLENYLIIKGFMYEIKFPFKTNNTSK
jgi:hypothetical protein